MKCKEGFPPGLFFDKLNEIALYVTGEESGMNHEGAYSGNVPFAWGKVSVAGSFLRERAAAGAFFRFPA